RCIARSLGKSADILGNACGPRPCLAQLSSKFRAEMTHIWQRVRSGDLLSAERARGYSLTLLAIAGIATAGWIAISDGLIDRDGKPARDNLCAGFRPRRITGHHRDARALRLHPACIA